nr:ABC transporter ATP-binding protein [Mesorhizobium sp.]
MNQVLPFRSLPALERPEVQMTPAAGREPLSIDVSGVSKSYEAFRALDGVSLHVAAGEFVTLLGPSGSGKTTLLNIIAGFVRPDYGRVRFGDEDVTLRPVNRRGLGMVFQNYALFPHMTVGENVAFPLKVRRVSKEEIGGRVEEVLRLVQLEHLAGRSVTALSGGQRQRVALARAVVFSPQIVLMDEPLSALDKNLREEMQVEIRQLHKKIGATTVYVTHDQREALTMSDRIAVMNKGQIVQYGTPEDVYNSPNSTFAAQFIGETTLLPGMAGDQGMVVCDDCQIRSARPLPAGRELVVALRAERLLLPQECNKFVNRIPARIADVIYQGDSMLVLADVGGGQRLSIRRSLRVGLGGPIPKAGEKLMLGIDPEDVIVVPRT